MIDAENSKIEKKSIEMQEAIYHRSHSELKEHKDKYLKNGLKGAK